MKFAVSNIAWRADEDEKVRELLPEFNVSGVELAPPRIWPDPRRASSASVREQQRFWESRGLAIIALQSLLFGRPELTLFGDETVREEMAAYLSDMISLARDLGAKVLVFGSPKNRQKGNLTAEEAQAIAVPFFRDLGNRAIKAGVCFCIEPNPAYYACDFVTTSAEGLSLVKAVNSPGFGLHLDAAAMTLAEEPIDSALAAAKGQVQHFHISEKDLGPVGSGSVQHGLFATALKKMAYRNWASVEMRPLAVPDEPRGRHLPDNTMPLQKALATLNTAYGQ